MLIEFCFLCNVASERQIQDVMLFCHVAAGCTENMSQKNGTGSFLQ